MDDLEPLHVVCTVAMNLFGIQHYPPPLSKLCAESKIKIPTRDWTMEGQAGASNDMASRDKRTSRGAN